MSEDSNIGDEEIIAFLMGELDEDKKLMVKKALENDPHLQKQERMLADSLRLIEKSCKESIPKIAEEDWSLSESQKEKIFSKEEPELDESDNEINDHSTEGKKSRNLLFWVPLGVAACAFLIVMVSEPNKQKQIESAAIINDKTEETKDVIQGKEDLILNEDIELNQMLQNKAQEGVNLALAKRTTTEVLAMNEELKKVPSLADTFAPNDSPPSPKMSLNSKVQELASLVDPKNSIKKKQNREEENLSLNLKSMPPQVDVEPEPQSLALTKSKQKEGNSSPFALNSLIEAKRSLARSRTNRTDAIPIPTPASEQIEAAEGSIVFKSESDMSYIGDSSADNASDLIGTGEPVSELAKASSTPLVAENNQSLHKKNGYDLIDRSKSVYLFTPKAKALGKVKIVNRTGQNFELLRLHETRLGKSTLLSGEDYQLRFTSDDESVIILVGNLKRKEEENSQRDPENINELSSYFFEIKEAWELDEKEIRKPYNLNSPK